ncbi:polysaccharide lyase [Halosolutus gelatinilyticus]|uniref:polysaccharide lyase n=1 Tax=Halosolutus gelatinilyticus TaxID=2931975 RepID=UPI001FF21DAC|nr:polysaccharide lyase [Halosolutus gelatinilyticus]
MTGIHSDRTGANDAAASTTNNETTRRRVLRAGGIACAGGLVGSIGPTVDRVSAATQTDDGQREVTRLDYDDYERWDDVYWLSNGDSDNVSFVSDPTYTGDTALQIRIREGDHWGASTHYDLDDGLLELSGRVHFALDSDWAMDGRDVANCRLWNCAMGLGEGSAGGDVPDGTNGWSNRLYVTTEGASSDGPFHLLSNTYHIDKPQDHDYLVDGEEYAVRAPEIVPGQWYELEYYVRVNSVDDGEAISDGVVRYWLDGELVYDRGDFRFTKDLETNAIDTTGPAGHYGGRYVAPQPLSVYYDSHSIVQNGTFEGEPTEPADPKPPTEIDRPGGIELPDGVDLPDWLTALIG